MSSRAVYPVIAIVLTLLIFGTPAETQQQPPYLNPSLPIDRRVDDLVSRMTLEEKVSQMMNVAPAITRLGIPEYDWWNEALHGVANSGVATVFPQAIGLGATFDTRLMSRVATVISDEARAKYHEAQRLGNHNRFYGLTFWSPNINIFRDPRWGRGQETYGEDPYLTARLGVEFVKGLQGNDPKYFKGCLNTQTLRCSLRPRTRTSPLRRCGCRTRTARDIPCLPFAQRSQKRALHQ
jgi:beta-glucosidase